MNGCFSYSGDKIASNVYKLILRDIISVAKIYPVHAGARLASPTLQEVIDTYELRAELKVIAIKRAVKSIKPVQIYVLEENTEEERRIFCRVGF